MTMTGKRDLDIVVFGATGFVGRLVAQYLAKHAPDEARIGLAGRSKARLGEVRAQLGMTASTLPLLVCDSSDPASLAAVAGKTRVVATTVDAGEGVNVEERMRWGERGRGLFGMQERLALVRGQLVIDSTPHIGTRIDARVPARVTGLA